MFCLFVHSINQLQDRAGWAMTRKDESISNNILGLCIHLNRLVHKLFSANNNNFIIIYRLNVCIRSARWHKYDAYLIGWYSGDNAMVLGH